MPIYGHAYITHNSVIFGPIPNIFIYGCSRDDYLPERLLSGGWGVRLDLAPGKAHLRRVRRVERKRCS